MRERRSPTPLPDRMLTPCPPADPPAPQVADPAGRARAIDSSRSRTCITLVRLLCLPAVPLPAVRARRPACAAAVLLAVLGATDWVDGYVARRYDQVSELGKMLDPAADRLLFIVASSPSSSTARVPVVVLPSPCSSARSLDVRHGGASALLGAKRIDVTWFGKAGTFVLMFAFPLFLVGSTATPSCADAAEVARLDVGIPGLVLAYYAAVLYIPLGDAAPAPRGSGRPGRAPTSAPSRPGHRVGSGAVKAVIMAGGEGTRLRPLTSNAPKPMLPLVNRPMMEHIIDLLKTHGIDEIVVTVAFMANAIRNYFGDGSEFGVRMVYATEETPLGTAGSVRNAMDAARRALPRDLRRRPHRHRPLGHRRRSTTSKDALATIGLAPRREPARVRHRHHPRGRLHRALPREAHVGPGVQRHHQHRHLRARARDLRLHRARPPGRLLRRGVPQAARGRPAALRRRRRRATGRTSARSTPTCGPTRTSSTARSRSTSPASRSTTACGWGRAPRSTPRPTSPARP